MCAFKVLQNTLNISHGHKFTGWLGRRTQVKSFKLASMSHICGRKILYKQIILYRNLANKGG